MVYKRCPKCNRITTKEKAKFCTDDGTDLAEIGGEYGDSEEFIQAAIDILQRKSYTGRGFSEDIEIARQLLSEARERYEQLRKDFGVDVQPALTSL